MKIHDALVAMSGAFDIDQAATSTSAIGQCREALKFGFIHAEDSKAFNELSNEEIKTVLKYIKNHPFNPNPNTVSVISLIGAFNKIITIRKQIRIKEENR